MRRHQRGIGLFPVSVPGAGGRLLAMASVGGGVARAERGRAALFGWWLTQGHRLHTDPSIKIG